MSGESNMAPDLQDANGKWVAHGTRGLSEWQGRVHLLSHEPYGQRVAVCGEVEHSLRGERLNFTIQHSDTTCRPCRSEYRRCGVVIGEQNGEPVVCGAVEAIHGSALGKVNHQFEEER